MPKLTRVLLIGAVLAVLAGAAFAAFARVNLVAPQAPACGGGGQPATPPAQLVSPADYIAQGDYDFDQGNCDRAIADYSRAMALDPEEPAAYNNRAYAYMAQQNYAAALPDLDEAIALRPDYVNALMNRGDIYNFYYHIDYDKALADYDRVLALHAQGTSVCGHRLLAQHHGWSLGALLTVVVSGPAEAGCQ